MSHSDIWAIVAAWGEGQSPSALERQRLIDWELNGDRSRTWRLNAQTIQSVLTARAEILQALHRHKTVLPLSGSWQDHIELLWTFWLPFAQRLDAQQKDIDRPFIQGILGGQGTGKTTLTKGLSAILSQMGQLSATLSLDDLYLSYENRQALQRLDPRLIWRGPPGTHDITLGVRTLTAIKTAPFGDNVSLPQFDKSLHQGQGDRIESLNQPAPNIFFFEGWFVGAMPLDDALFTDPKIKLPAPIETPEDRQFARDMNHQLRQYQPLWNLLDSLVVLLQEDYRLSYDWRLQAEQQMRKEGREGLSDQEIASFVTYFWKALHPDLFIAPLAKTVNPLGDRRQTDLVVEIGQGHRIKTLYSP